MDITSCTKNYTRGSQPVNINDIFFPLARTIVCRWGILLYAVSSVSI